MTDLAALHAEALRSFGRIVAAVRPRAWEAPTPCAEWCVHDVVDHVVAENLWVPELLAGHTIEEVGDRFDGDVLGVDPVESYRRSASPAAEAASRPGALDRIVDLSFGPTVAAVYIAQRLFDLVIHGWDVARGAGVVGPIDPGLASVLYPLVDAWADGWQGSGIFAPPVPVSDDAPLVDRLLALTGRDPSWTPPE